MKCAWQAYLNILPLWMRSTVDKLGKETLQELRLRCGKKPEMIMRNGNYVFGQAITKDELQYCINAASRYSPWTAATAAQGYLTAPGGHRLGICGDATVLDAVMIGIRSPTSLCIRVARDFPGIANSISKVEGSVLIIGSPGSGKTTLLRDLIRCKSEADSGSVAVVDERGEIFPVIAEQNVFFTGRRTDVLTGCCKKTGIEAVLRNMGPAYIAVDEITAEEDCKALIHAGWCGVKLIATAHAASKEDLLQRPVYRPLHSSGLFDTVLILQSDKSWTMERMDA